MASVRYLKRGKKNLWTYTIRDETSKTIAYKSGFDTKKKAQIEAEKLLRKLNHGFSLDNKMSLYQLYQEWLNLKILPSKRSQTTKNKYIMRKEIIKKLFGDTPVSQIKPSNYQRIMNDYGKTVTRDTLSRLHTSIKECIKTAQADKIFIEDFTFFAELFSSKESQSAEEKYIHSEKDLNNIITKNLKKNNFSVDSVYDGEEALKYSDYGNYDLILLDVMLPKMNGYEVVKHLRANKNETAVLMLTARDGIDEKIKGLDLGADDYLVKPFDFRELIARIRALVRRKYGNISNELQIDDLIVDISKKSVTRAGKNIELTGKEYEVLEYLIQNKGRVLSRDKIRDGVWDYAYEGESNIIDVLIKNIRKKIDIGDSKPIIHTKRGLGYVLKEDE